ncbi:MAG: Aminoacyltransferase femX [Marmoricola sp.]|nr:Aminoacyltransferase femX [Marmoricola sp.]
MAAGKAEWARHAGVAGWTVFHSWEWLSWVAPLLDCEFVPLVVRRGGVSVGLAPMLVRKRLVGTANNVDFNLGPLVPREDLAKISTLIKHWALRHGVLSIELAVHATAEMPPGSFARAGLNETSEETYLIRLEGRSVADILSSVSSDVRNALRRSVKRGVTVRTATPDELRHILPGLREQALGVDASYAHRFGEGLADGEPPFPVRCSTAVVEGRPVGMSVTIGGLNATGWMGSVFREDQRTQAHSALVWDAIEWAHAEQCSWLDMGGAPDPGIGAYKRKFKPQIGKNTVASWEVPGLAAAQRARTALVSLRT